MCVAREIGTYSPPQSATTCPTCGASKQASTSQKISQPFIDGGGANFVDATLKVVVKAAVGTLFIFQPDQLHGTTLAYGAVNHNIAITFSQRVADEYREVLAKGQSISSGGGAGEGNPANDK